MAKEIFIILLQLVGIVLLPIVAFLAGRLHELRKQTERALDQELANLKHTEAILQSAVALKKAHEAKANENAKGATEDTTKTDNPKEA